MVGSRAPLSFSLFAAVALSACAFRGTFDPPAEGSTGDETAADAGEAGSASSSGGSGSSGDQGTTASDASGDGDATSADTGDGDSATDTNTGDGDATTTGDGDATTTTDTGDGDATSTDTGDGDSTTTDTGDGDGTTTDTGDGDGTTTDTGDGDGDGTASGSGTWGDGDGATTGPDPVCGYQPEMGAYAPCLAPTDCQFAGASGCFTFPDNMGGVLDGHCTVGCGAGGCPQPEGCLADAECLLDQSSGIEFCGLLCQLDDDCPIGMLCRDYPNSSISVCM